jgi:hypothetical protein
MDRRSFLTRSAIGGGVILVASSGLASGCISSAHPSLETGRSEELLSRLHRGLGHIRAVPEGEIARAISHHPRPVFFERVMRLGLEALVVMDVTQSLQPGLVLPPDLSRGLAPELPIVDRYASTYHGLLTSMPHQARQRLSTKVRARPSAPMDIAEWIDARGNEIGIAPESRGSLRSIASQLGTRMRRQSTNAVLDDCIAKVDRVFAQSGQSLALVRAHRTNAMLASIWQQVDDAALGSGLSDPLARQAAAGVDEDLAWQQVTQEYSPPLWSARWGRPGDEEIELGGILMPLGLITCGVLLIAGLLVLIAGGVQNAEWDGLPRSAR